jgi:hypothetical protein
MKYLYIVDFWVPFPSSEYGGLINVIAANDNECHDILRDSELSYNDAHDHLIMHEVVNAPRYALVDDLESGIVSSFVT